MKKILLTLMACMAISFALPPAARALTAADLVGKDVSMLLMGTFMEQSLYKGQYSGKIEIRDGQLYITNFLGRCDVPVYISGNNIAVPTNTVGEKDNVTYQFVRTDGGHAIPNTVWTTNNYESFQYWGYWIPDNSDIILEMVESANGNMQFKCKMGIRILEDEDGDGYADNIDHFNGMTAIVSSYNSTAVEYRLNANGEYDAFRSYNANVAIDGNSIAIINWKNQGYLYDTQSKVNNASNYLHGLDGTIDANGNVRFGKQEIGALVSFGYYESAVTYSGWTRYIHETGFQTYAGQDGYWYLVPYNWSTGTSYLPNVYRKYSQKSSTDGTITGLLTSGTLSHNKSGVDNMWTTNGGDLKTFEGKSLILDEDEIYSAYNSGVVNGSHADMTVFQINDIDVTHDASLKIDGFYFNNEEVYVQGSIRNRMNCQHHESYDLYMIPGNHYDLNNVETVAHHDTGLEGAVCVLTDLRPSEEPVDDYDEYDEYGEEGMIARAPSTANITLAHQVKWPEGIQKDASTYTFFLKSKYADDKNLEPTFLSMAAPGIVTGIGNLVDFNPDMIVRPVAGGVEVEGFDGKVEVYSVAGTCVFSGVADGLIELSQGTYIVRAALRSWKVNVN